MRTSPMGEAVRRMSRRGLRSVRHTRREAASPVLRRYCAGDVAGERVSRPVSRRDLGRDSSWIAFPTRSVAFLAARIRSVCGLVRGPALPADTGRGMLRCNGVGRVQSSRGQQRSRGRAECSRWRAWLLSRSPRGGDGVIRLLSRHRRRHRQPRGIAAALQRNLASKRGPMEDGLRAITQTTRG